MDTNSQECAYYMCYVTIISFLFRAVFSISVSLSCPTVCLVVLQIACLLLDE